MTITLHCLDCGFRFSLTVSPREVPGIPGAMSCGHCGCRRWASV